MSANNTQKKGTVVPFGKYRGQPVEVLAADPSYCEWLTAQDWFRDRFKAIHLLIVNHFHQPEETPAHSGSVELHAGAAAIAAWNVAITRVAAGKRPSPQ